MASGSEETKILVAYKTNTLKGEKMELEELSFLYFECGGSIIICGEDQDVTDEVREFIEKNGLKLPEEFLPEFLSLEGISIVVSFCDGTDVTNACYGWLSETSASDEE